MVDLSRSDCQWQSFQRHSIFNENDKKSKIEIGPNKSVLLYSIENRLFNSRNHLQEILV